MEGERIFMKNKKSIGEADFCGDTASDHLVYI